MDDKKVKYNKIPDIIGKSEDDARDYLSKKKIKVKKFSVKKFNLNYKSGTVIKVVPDVNTKIAENKYVKIYVAENRLFTLFLAFLVVLLGVIFYYGYQLSYVMLNVDGPYIQANQIGYTTSNVIRVTAKSELENYTNYQYCMTSSDNANNCIWKSFEGDEFVVSDSGKWNIYVRAYNNHKKTYSLKSNKVEVFIDREQPIISNVQFVKNRNKVKFEVEANDYLSGIKSYFYSLDGVTYIKTEEEFEVYDLTTDRIYVKVVDQLDNETIKEVII